jgi:hypothetical protein
MSIKRINSQSYIQNKHTIKDDKTVPITSGNGILLKKSEKLIQSSKQKRHIAPDKLKLMRHVFTTISNSQPSMILIYISHKNYYSSACSTSD